MFQETYTMINQLITLCKMLRAYLVCIEVVFIFYTHFRNSSFVLIFCFHLYFCLASFSTLFSSSLFFSFSFSFFFSWWPPTNREKGCSLMWQASDSRTHGFDFFMKMKTPKSYIQFLSSNPTFLDAKNENWIQIQS